jgi:predicted ATP-dependent Lon-type protease
MTDKPLYRGTPKNFAFSAGGSISYASGLTVESSEDKLVIIGGMTITRDVKGLKLAQSMAQLLFDAVKMMEQDQAAGNLPEEIAVIAPTVRANPLNA